MTQIRPLLSLLILLTGLHAVPAQAQSPCPAGTDCATHAAANDSNMEDENGSDGTNGSDGANGTDGTDGADGADGTDGTDGTDGADASH